MSLKRRLGDQLLNKLIKYICNPNRTKFNKKLRLSEKKLAQKFVDERIITFIGGRGGDGKSLFHRDRITITGGPKGGNGGKGGDVIVVADSATSTLQKLRHLYKAENGSDGGSFAGGKYGKDLIVKVPIGTIFRLEESYDVVKDLSEDGDNFMVCIGGVGGKGNKFFASSINTTPEKCTPGTNGETVRLVLELKTIANGGLVGFPNVGKSTLLRAISRAIPHVAPYNFTTLVPHIGVINYDDFTKITIADTPGVIEGVSLNRGLGFKFLKHIDRCEFLIYVIDLSVTDPWMQVEILKEEFSRYNPDLLTRPTIILGNKIDLTSSESAFPDFKTQIEKDHPNWFVMCVSGKKGHCIEDVIEVIRFVYDMTILKKKSI